MKNDERLLLDTLKKRTLEDPHEPYVRRLVADIGMNEKRAAYILNKWVDKGWYECGVSVMAGWLTPKGLDA